MSHPTREQLTVGALQAEAPEIGRALWALEDERHRTLAALDGFDESLLAWASPGGNSVGALLYHIAAIELDWLFAEVLELPDAPPELAALFPHDIRETNGRLSAVPDMAMVAHMERLAAVRRRLLATFETMPPTEYRRARHLPRYGVTPEWVLHHVGQHEAEHRGELATVRRLAKHATTDATNRDANKALIRAVFEDVWNRANLDRIDDLFDAGFVRHGAAADHPPGPDGEKQHRAAFQAAFPDLAIAADEIIAEGDRVAVRYTWRGTYQGTWPGIPQAGIPVTMTGIAIHRVAGGKVTELRMVGDELGLMRQLGVAPATAL